MADTLHTIKCPACGKEMNKILMKSCNIHLDVCLDGCGGIYFDNREFKHFDEKNEDITELIEAIENKIFIEVDDKKQKVCPVCSANMVQNYASAKHAVLIDECYTCGGKFLDHNELTKIRNEYENEKERSDDFTRYLYSQIGIEMNLMEEKHKEALENRSILKKLFDKIC